MFGKRRSRNGHRRIAFLAVASLLMHALVFAWHTPEMAAGSGVDAAGHRTIVICTGQGFKTIAIDADGRPIKAPTNGPEAPNLSKSCPVCTALAGFVMAPVAAPPDAGIMARTQAVAYIAAVDRARDRRPRIRNGHDPPLAS